MAELVTVTTSNTQIGTEIKCARRGFWAYHYQPEPGGPRGIQSRYLSLYLLTGSCVHEGLAELFRSGGDIEKAVLAGLGAFHKSLSGHGLAIDAFEPEKPVGDQIWSLVVGQETSTIEALLRAFYLQVYPMFMERFEILSIEEEGQPFVIGMTKDDCRVPIVYRYRLDLLVLNKSSRTLHSIRFKCLAQWSVQQARQYAIDSQGIAESWGMNSQMELWHQSIQCPPGEGMAEIAKTVPDWYMRYFSCDDHPPRVESYLMCILLKGAQREIKDIPAPFKQRYSPLIRGYRLADSPAGTDGLSSCWAHSWDVPKTGKNGPYMGNLGSSWKPVRIGEEFPGGIKAWVEALHAGQIQPELGAILERCFVFAEADELKGREEEIESWYRQIRNHSVEYGTRAEELNGVLRSQTISPDVKLQVMDRLFVQNRDNCYDYQSACPFVNKVCFRGLVEHKIRPELLGELYEPRVDHHGEEEE